MIVILYSFISDASPDDVTFWRLLAQLPPKMQEQVLSYKFRKDGNASLVGKLLIRKGFEYLGISSGHFLSQIQYTAYNKPYIPGSQVDFNLSHSGECVICAMSMSCRLGIDIEYIQPIPMEDFSDYMSDAEWARIKSAEDHLSSFYRYWTEKESVIKADGKGLSIPLKEFSIVLKETQIDQTRWYLREIPVHGDYICHLATDLSGKPLERQMIIESFL